MQQDYLPGLLSYPEKAIILADNEMFIRASPNWARRRRRRLHRTAAGAQPGVFLYPPGRPAIL
ncbi:hypothetical protein QNM99_09015 [Pseudomonas sp. PCH446]